MVQTKDYQFWHPMTHPNNWENKAPLRIVKGDGLFVGDAKPCAANKAVLCFCSF